jgi:hypothetical protein
VAAIGSQNVKLAFTAVDTPGYFTNATNNATPAGTGDIVNIEKLVTGTGANKVTSEQVYVDANKDGSFEAAIDLVIHLDNTSAGLTNLDFHFH